MQRQQNEKAKCSLSDLLQNREINTSEGSKVLVLGVQSRAELASSVEGES